MLKEEIDKDLKTALLQGDKVKATTLRGLKSTILYAEVAQNKRQEGLSDDEIVNLFAKEAKKRQESADLYVQGGSQEKADAELKEKALIEEFLPKKISDEEVTKKVEDYIRGKGNLTIKDMGSTIAAIKADIGAGADGGQIAALVKQRLSQ